MWYKIHDIYYKSNFYKKLVRPKYEHKYSHASVKKITQKIQTTLQIGNSQSATRQATKHIKLQNKYSKLIELHQVMKSSVV